MTRSKLQDAAFWGEKLCLKCWNREESLSKECSECGSPDLEDATDILRLFRSIEEAEAEEE